MRSKEEQEQIIKRALSMSSVAGSEMVGGREGSTTGQREDTPAGQVSAALLAEHNDTEVNAIVDVWHRVFGFSESREQIAAHLRMLRRWQRTF